MKHAFQENGGRLFGPEMLEDPYTVYRELRETDPVYFDDTLGSWVVTRHADITTIMKDSAFSSDRVAKARTRFSPEFQSVFDTLALLLLQMDDPGHKRLRDLIHSAFIRTTVENYEAQIRQIAGELLAPGLQSGTFEFVADYAIPLPIMVISEIVGIPAEDRDQVKAWCDDFSHVALNFYANISEERLRQGKASMDALSAYIGDKADAARRHPGNDLLSSLALAETDDHALSPAELLANTILLLNAGNDTTSSLIANGMAMLLADPDMMARLRSEPALLPYAVEEFLRCEPPVQFLGRLAVEDRELGGQKIRAGDMVLVVMGSAGRDPEAHTDPDRIDIARKPNHHLAFGTGRHMCAGIHLARLEARIAFEEILKHFGSIEPLYTETSHRPNFNMRCVASLPARVSA